MGSHVRARVTYEQCPWDKEHVEAIYVNLKGILQADGEWHDIALPRDRIGRYRVFQQSYFQAVYARNRNRLFQEIMGLEPLQTQDDTEWDILQYADGYGLSSYWSTTPGVFVHQKEQNEWMFRHGLGFDPGSKDSYYVLGIAYFADLERGCVEDAIQRLAWFELALRDLHERYNALGKKFWTGIKKKSDKVLARFPDLDVEEEIIPLPDIYRPEGFKHREPLPPDYFDQE